MKAFDFRTGPGGETWCEVYLRGQELLAHPLLNKGACFTREERRALGLAGLLPHGVSIIEDQLARCLECYRRKPDDLERYVYLLELLNRNETLFYRLLTEHLEEMVPVVYTPTVGQACLEMSRLLRRPRGLYLHPDNLGEIDAILRELPQPGVRLIVVTDGERILGLGDLGADGMGIPVGKVALYVAAGGLHPADCLPVCLDVGTDNERLLADPLYMGWRHPRLRGAAYFDFVERFVAAVERAFPGCLLQWEDFAKGTAFTLLERYRDRLPSFDDDIQGTGATACAALLTAARIQGRRMRDQRIAIMGMGQAGTGIALCIKAVLEEEGLSPAEVRERFFAIDLQGLLLEDDPRLEAPQRPFARPRASVEGWTLDKPDAIGLKDVVRNARPTVLIGVTAQPGLFDAEILAAMGEASERPVLFALSNPTCRCECQPIDALCATGGRALLATGSPFAPVAWEGRTLGVAQCNNLFIFPGVGLGARVAGTPRITDAMFVKAAHALSELVTPEQMAHGHLLPEMKDIRRASGAVALAVAREARDSGLGLALEDEALAARVAAAQWRPAFVPFGAGRRD